MRLAPFAWTLGGAAALFAALAAPVAQAQVPLAPGFKQPFASEDKDWGVAATTSPKRGTLHAPTPTTLPGGRVIRTMELRVLLEENKDVVVVDVLDSKTRATIPGAFWMSGAGAAAGTFYGADMARFTEALAKVTGGDMNRPLVFLCFSSECWLSYNASLRAIEAGYKDVLWYRGGTEAWRAADFGLREPKAGW